MLKSEYILMRIKKVTLVILLLSLTTSLSSQIAIQPSEGKTPEEIVKDFVMGDGITVTNVKFNGHSGKLNKKVSVQLGTFSNDEKGFPDFFSSGIILCTGNCKMAEGPNDDEGKTDVVHYFPPSKCRELEKIISPYPANYPAILEFDFSSVTNHVRFRYCFASEEYPVFSCSQFNYVFGFFVTDKKTGEKKNIALIPGTNDAVSVNNIHPDFGKGCKAVHAEYLTMLPHGSKKMQFNGYVGPFIAEADLKPGRTYHITLAIAHASDLRLESAVFLEASSFSAVDENGTVIMSDGTPATYSKTDTLPKKTAKGIPLNDINNGKGTTRIDVLEMRKDSTINYNNYFISTETTYDYLFDSISVSIENDSIVLIFHARGKWCDCFYPNEIPVNVILTPKSVTKDGSKLERIVIPVVNPIIEKKPWLSRCFWVLASLVALLAFIFYLRALLKKNRFHKNARLKNSYVVDGSPKETQKDGRPMRKDGFGPWINRWFNPFVDEKNTIKFTRPKTPAITFTASGTKNKILLSEASFDSKKMTIPGYTPPPKDQDKKTTSTDKPIDISAGTAIEIKKTQSGTTTRLGHLTYSVEGKDDIGGYRLFIVLLMLVDIAFICVLLFLMLKTAF